MKTIQITAAHADELMEQREQSQACLGYAEIPEQSSPTRSLSRLKKTEVQKIKQLYETAFPEDEQIPWDDLMAWLGKCRWISRLITMVKSSSASPLSIHVSHSTDERSKGRAELVLAMPCKEEEDRRSTGSGTLPCERNCEAKVLAIYLKMLSGKRS